MDNTELKIVFDLAYKKLSEISINDNFDREITERRTRVFDKNKPDSYFFEHMVRAILNAGMKATVVTNKMPYVRKAFFDFDVDKVSVLRLESLLSNPQIIHYERKMRDCIANAGKIKKISEEFGSFGEFLNENQKTSTILKGELMKFGSIGRAVVLDYLKNIGMDFVKPDVHILRVFSRLGLIDSEASFYPAINAAESFKQATAERLSVIDAVFWMYGSGGDGHLSKAMCSKNNPLCNECPLTGYCTIKAERS